MWMMKAGTGAVETLRELIGTGCEASPPLQAKPSLARGDRVRMSALARARHPRYGDLQGVIVGRGSPSSWRVKFDQRKCIQALHRDYLEKVARPGAGCGQSCIGEIATRTASAA
jgi:hypothetical protein